MNTNLKSFSFWTMLILALLETAIFAANGIKASRVFVLLSANNEIIEWALCIALAITLDIVVYFVSIKLLEDLFYFPPSGSKEMKKIVTPLLLFVVAIALSIHLSEYSKEGLSVLKKEYLEEISPKNSLEQRKIDSLALVFDQKKTEVEKLYLPKNETLIKSLEERLADLHAELAQKQDDLDKKFPVDIQKMFPKKYEKALFSLKEIERKIEKTNSEIERIEKSKTEMLVSPVFQLQISKIETEKEAKISEIQTDLSKSEQAFLSQKAKIEEDNNSLNNLFRLLGFGSWLMKVGESAVITWANFCLLFTSFFKFFKRKEDQQPEQTIIGNYAVEDYEAIFETIVSKLPKNTEVKATYLAEQALLFNEKTHQSSSNIARYARTYVANLKTEQHSKTVVGKIENAINTIKQLLFGKAQTPKSEPVQAKNEKTAPQTEPITKAETPRKTVNPSIKPDMTGRQDLKLKYIDKEGHSSTKIITFSEGNYQNAEEAVADWIDEGKNFENIAEILNEATNVHDYDHVYFSEVFVKIWNKKATEKLFEKYGTPTQKRTPSRVKIAED